jgi:hypothetical protein
MVGGFCLFTVALWQAKANLPQKQRAEGSFSVQ